ncbi:MAG: amidohydrolase family protein [Verrucomicrobiota bacterium]
MKNRNTRLGCYLMMLLGWAIHCFADENAPVVFQNVQVFDGMEILPHTTVVVQGRTIVAVGASVKPPAGATVIDGEGQTLLPGLIDAHVHNDNEPLLLRQAAVFGVTTVLNMFTGHPQHDVQMRKEQEAGLATNRADLFTAGIGVTAKGGHGTQYGVVIPTLDDPADAQAFIDARIAEGSDYIKIILEPGELNRRVPKRIPTLSPETAAAAVAAAQRRGKLAVFHVANERSARQALEAGANGLVHIYDSGTPNWEIARLAKAKGAFVMPTLTVSEPFMGIPGGGIARG